MIHYLISDKTTTCQLKPRNCGMPGFPEISNRFESEVGNHLHVIPVTRVLISIKAAHPNYTNLSSFIYNQNLSHSHHKQGVTFSV